MALLELPSPDVGRTKPRRGYTESMQLFDRMISLLIWWGTALNYSKVLPELEEFAEKLMPQAECDRYRARLSKYSTVGRWASVSLVNKGAPSLSLLVSVTYRSDNCCKTLRDVIWVSYGNGGAAISLIGANAARYKLPGTPEEITCKINSILNSLVLTYKKL